MIPSETGRDWPDSVLLSTIDRVFEAALPVLSASATNKERVAEIRIMLSRTLVELASDGVTGYPDLLRSALEKVRLEANGPAAIRT